VWEGSGRVFDLEDWWVCCCCRRGADCFGGRGGGASEKGLDMATREGKMREEERRGELAQSNQPRHHPQALAQRP
jgi:hypothetical protein